MYWMVVWSLYLLGLSGSFTLRGLGLVGGWGAGGWCGVAVACWGAPTRLHGAVSDRCFGSSSADSEREVGPRGAACAAGSCGGFAICAQSARGVAVRVVCRGIGSGACRD